MKTICITLVIILFSCNSKVNKPKETIMSIIKPPELNPNNYDEIGFKCNNDGKGTLLVEEFCEIIKNRNFEKLKKELFNKRPGRYYLATFSCEILANEGMINLEAKDLNQIKKNRTKNDTVFTCSGCTYTDFFTVNKLLSDTSNYINFDARMWFDNILGKNIIVDK
jgi:hypothetical protein